MEALMYYSLKTGHFKTTYAIVNDAESILDKNSEEN